MDKNKRIIIIVSITILILSIVGGTLAYWSWRTTDAQKTNITFTITSDFSCSADGGGNIEEGDANIIPTYLKEEYAENYIKREITVSPKINSNGKTIYMDLWLDIKELGEGLSLSENFRYMLTTNGTLSELADNEIIVSGNFNGKVAGDKIQLLNIRDYSATTTEKYYLFIWLDSEQVTSETMNQKFKLSLNGNCYDNLDSEVGVELLTAKANPSTLAYSDATNEQRAEMWTFSEAATAQTAATTDYRYIGVSPKNYIRFNNEMWRIIGVFDGRIKIIRDESIGNLSWDYKMDVGSATSNGTSTYSTRAIQSGGGSNDWTDSQLMYMLNPGSYKLKTGYSLNNNIIYDNNNKLIYQLGCLPSRITSESTSYNCVNNNWELNAKALSRISEVTYYLGNDFSLLSSGNDTPEIFYASERGTDVYKNRPVSWNGLVGLAYVSDYLYTLVSNSGGNARSAKISGGGSRVYSWMIDNHDTQWTISPYYDETTDYVFSVYSNIFTNYPNEGLEIRPVVYLNSNTELARNGTIDDPYLIAN